MAKKHDYIIVGAEVDVATYNVETIGKLMVKLSKSGKPAEAVVKAHEETVRKCLVVHDRAVQTGAPVLTDAEKAGILKETKVKITFEERTHPAGASDVNARALVVPADRTLELKEQMLASGTTGFVPPLSYPLDEKLMWSAHRKEILEMVEGFAAEGAAGWTPALQASLEAYMAGWLRSKIYTLDAAGDIAVGDVKNEIVKDALRAFYRSVGIYATNMCR